jgi:hypothetical protein
MKQMVLVVSVHLFNLVTQKSKGMKFKMIWDKQAHKEKIKSVHYSEYIKLIKHLAYNYNYHF